MNIWDALLLWGDRANILFGLAAAVFSIGVWIKLKRQNKKLQELAKAAPSLANFKELVKYHSGIKTSNPKALTLSLLPGSVSLSIKNAVESFLKRNALKMDVEEIIMDGLSPDKVEDFINKLHEKRRLFDVQNVTEVHIFIAGPVVAGLITGAVLDNWIPVKIYHKPRNKAQDYEYWGPLIK